MNNPISVAQIVSLNDTGDSTYRMLWPAQTLAAANPSWSVCNIDASYHERYVLAEQADLLVLFNCADADFLPLIERRKARGLKTLVEYNDNFYEPQAWSPIIKEWSSWQIHQIYELFMKMADGVVVTAEGLKQLFAPKTDQPIFIIENILPRIEQTFTEIVSDKEGCTFGWAGSLGHIADILSVGPVIASTLSENPKAKFYLMGNESLASILHLPASQYKHFHWGSIDDYYRFWKPIQVGLIPMLNTPYNQCRSDIKAIEMIANGVVPLVPDLLPYQALIKQFNLPSYNDFDSMHNLLRQVLGLSDEQRKAIIEPAFEWLKDTRTDNCAARQAVYEQFLPAKEQRAQSNPWPLTGGYHHLAASSGIAEGYAGELKKIQALFKQGNLEIAQRQMERLYAESPHHPEVSYSYVSYVLSVDAQKGKELLLKAIEEFPNDLRFRLKLILSSSEVSKKIEAWRQFLIFFRTQSVHARRSGRELIAGALVGHLRMPSLMAEQAMREIGEEFLLLFPFSYNVRLALAEAYEKNGYNKEAAAQFGALAQAKRHYDEGVSEIASLEYGYLAAWHEACDKRVKRRLK